MSVSNTLIINKIYEYLTSVNCVTNTFLCVTWWDRYKCIFDFYT